MDYEKAIYKKRAFIGYEPKSVREYIKFLQKQQKKEWDLLQQKMMQEKERNQKLKEELEYIEQLPQINPIAEELNKLLMDLFIQHTKEIMDLKVDLKEQENKQLLELEKKLKQKEIVQKRVQDALQYIKALSSK